MKAPHPTRRRLSITTAIACFLLSFLTALPARASDPMTFVGIIGLPRLSNPEGVAVNADGDVYVAEPNAVGASTNVTERMSTTDDRVSHFDALGNYVGTWGLYGTGNGTFKSPEGIAVDSLGS